MTGPVKIADALLDRLTHGHERHGQRWHLHLPREEESAAQLRPLLVLLGLPTFGLAFAISVLTTYGPVILIQLTSSTTAVGAIIGGEGAFALIVPLAAGAISDRLPPSPLGRRFPFVVAGAPLAAVGLALLPFSSSTAIAAATVLAFFVGYYLYYPPYRALYADLLPRRLYARAQAGQADCARRRARRCAARRRFSARDLGTAGLPPRSRDPRGDDRRVAPGLSAPESLPRLDPSLSRRVAPRDRA
jgi:Major Facilitator Superfamily